MRNAASAGVSVKVRASVRPWDAHAVTAPSLYVIITSSYPDPFNALHRIYRFPGWEGLEAMGFETDGAIGGIQPSLLTHLRLMDEDEQHALLGVVKAMAKRE